MARFARAFRDVTGRTVFLLWTANNGHEIARAASERAGLSPDEYRIISSSSDEVADVLSAGDAGLALIKPCFSKKSSSPTKYAEYLAVGLPIIINRDVGDGVEVERAGGAVALGEVMDDDEMRDAVEKLKSLDLRWPEVSEAEHAANLAARKELEAEPAGQD